MTRTTLSIPDEVLERLRVIAAEEGTSMAALVRGALEDAIERRQPRPRSLGIGASGHRDTAGRAGAERPEPRSWR